MRWQSVAFVTRRRLARRWRALVVTGVLLGLGFGVCFASLAAARRTGSAYDRILDRADAPDAAVTLGRFPHQSERSLGALDEIVDQRVYAGFLGGADDVDGLLTTALLAPIRDRFPLDLPQNLRGRLPDADAPDEVFVAASAAERGGLELGQQLRFRLENPMSSAKAEPEVTIVGIGTLPVEAVADETMVFGIMVFTRAFYEAHRELVVYSASNVDLAPGVDARGELAVAAGSLGFAVQSARSQEGQAVDQALRPLIIVLVALGLLAFAATAVATALAVQRGPVRDASDDATLLTIGMSRGQVRLVELALSGVIAVVAVATALVAMLVASPVAPVGPLHALDPGQGFGLDGAVAVVGSIAVLATFGLLALAFSAVRTPRRTGAVSRVPRVSMMSGSPTAIAGLALAWRTPTGRSRTWRGVGATTAATALVALAASFVTSAVALTGTPARYGFDADLLALNAYGDQSIADLEQAFGDHPDVVAATAFTAGSYLVDGRAVPGLAATDVKRDVLPTLLRGVQPRTGGEIVLGQDTLDSIGAELGDIVPVRLFSATDPVRQRAGEPANLRIVGVATFPPVGQMGTDMPRLGIGALVTSETFRLLGGDETGETGQPNLPEFTSVRMVDGADPSALIEERPDGFEDTAQSTTDWFTDTKPAELRQLDGAMPYLGGGLAIGYAILVAIMVHALWSRSRANRRDFAVLGALGTTRRQLDAVAAWQLLPFVLGALLVGMPVGIILGRRTFVLFAQSLAVVDSPSTSVGLLAAIVGAVLVAAAAGGVAAMAVARRSRASIVLRGG